MRLTRTRTAAAAAAARPGSALSGGPSEDWEEVEVGSSVAHAV